MNKLALVFPKLFGVPDLPSQHEVDWLNESVRNSPDLGKLEQYEFQLLFCPDETQRGYSQHSIIEDSAFVCHAFTQRPFEFWQQRDGQVIPLESEGQGVVKYFPPPLKIKGELHAVRPYQFRHLDIYKDNKGQYDRRRVKLLVPYREVIQQDYFDEDGKELPLCLQGKKGILGPEQVHVVRAWMYIGISSYWNPILTPYAFKAVQTHQSRRPWLREYYSYPRREIIIRNNR